MIAKEVEDPGVIVVSAAMQHIQDELRQAARADAKILITGESGVGKEVVARQIHRYCTRAGRPFVAINCAGVPDSLLESELFGHVRGSFTGAYRDKPGLLEQAHGGTIFMDEVGEMSLRMQALLLRFLEDGDIYRVGSERTNATVNVRVVAATNRVLLDRIASNDFREDLYYRLNVIHLVIPPLRDRIDDIEPLLHHFLRDVRRQVQRRRRPNCDPEVLPAMLQLPMAGQRPRAEERRRAADRPRAQGADRRRGPAAAARIRAASRRASRAAARLTGLAPAGTASPSPRRAPRRRCSTASSPGANRSGRPSTRRSWRAT